MVIAVDRGRYLTRLDGRDVIAVKARELGHRGVVVGDLAYLVGDTSGDRGALARIVRIGPRRTELTRATEEGRGRERVIVAGADQMVVVTALAEPPPRIGMIDRQLVAAYDAGLEAVICLTKSDLGSPAELRALYEPLGVEVIATGRLRSDSEVPERAEDSERPIGADRGDGIGQPPDPLTGLEPLRERLTGHLSVLVGHSGVGKSTLINALVPGAARATGGVNLVTGKGRHTSSSAVALELPEGGWVIDTPGVRSFGLSHVRPERVLAAFPDLTDISDHCPRGCPHGPDLRECVLREWAQGSPERQMRLDSYSRIMNSLAAHDRATH
jgi:ribosome biogenesis GTPase